MKAIHLLLAVSFALAVTPFADATHGCSKTPPQEGMVHPLDEGRYLYIAGTDPANPGFDPAKFGEWTESNDKEGLQTDECFEHGLTWYHEDDHEAILP